MNTVKNEEPIECVTCQQKTYTTDIKLYYDARTNHRWLEGICVICKKNKSMYIAPIKNTS